MRQLAVQRHELLFGDGEFDFEAWHAYDGTVHELHPIVLETLRTLKQARL